MGSRPGTNPQGSQTLALKGSKQPRAGGGEVFEDVGEDLVDDLALEVGVAFFDGTFAFADVELCAEHEASLVDDCLLYTSPSPRDRG